MTNNPSNPISDTERQLIMDAAKARRRILRNKDVEKKPAVSPSEYAERLKNSLRKDATLLSTVREDTIAKSVQKWAELAGETFSHANTEMPAILERVNRLVSRKGLHKTSVIFFGDQLGRGKTWQAYSYLNQIVAGGAATPGQIVYGTEGSTMSALANSGYLRAEKEESFLKASHRYFFIDDVGQGHYFKEQARQEVWYALIDHIYTRQLTLVMTTNLKFVASGPNSLGQWIGFRAFDRLKSLVGDDGSIEIVGVNRRDEVLKANEQKLRKR